MKIAGIVAEYNPFHKGHEYQIQKIREMLGADTGVVCVMSGDFVQRGEPALFSKYARAEAAVRCGADLVIELPVQFSVASAERFAQGAVSVLGALGNVDYLVFGSESGNTDLIARTAVILESPAFDRAIKNILESGCSYPTARSKALRQLMDDVDVTVAPNDNLGVEYIRAINHLGLSMKPISIQRLGARHDCRWDGEMKSGSEIRAIALQGNCISDYVPKAAYEVYMRETERGRGLVSLEAMEQAILSRLRMGRLDKFVSLPDASEGLENRLFKACCEEPSLTAVYDRVKSKRYTHARIRRMTMCAALGISKEDQQLDRTYIRVLALNENGGKILRDAREQCTLPVISKPAAARKLDGLKRESFEKSANAHDLYALAYSDIDARRGGADWITGPFFLK